MELSPPQAQNDCRGETINYQKLNVYFIKKIMIMLYFCNNKHMVMRKKQIIERISKSIHKKDHTAEAFLFGSRARGDNRKDSDWDILILIDNNKVTNEIEDNFRDDLYNIELESGQIISTFIYSKDYWKNTLIYSPLYKNINREGVRL